MAITRNVKHVVPCLSCGKAPRVLEGRLLKEPYKSCWVECVTTGCWRGPIIKDREPIDKAVSEWNQAMGRG